MFNEIFYRSQDVIVSGLRPDDLPYPPAIAIFALRPRFLRDLVILTPLEARQVAGALNRSVLYAPGVW